VRRLSRPSSSRGSSVTQWFRRSRNSPLLFSPCFSSHKKPAPLFRDDKCPDEGLLLTLRVSRHHLVTNLADHLRITVFWQSEVDMKGQLAAVVFLGWLFIRSVVFTVSALIDYDGGSVAVGAAFMILQLLILWVAVIWARSPEEPSLRTRT
jgi:hypothetical protein